MSRITTPIQPFSDTFRRELVGMADSIEWWDRYRGEMERLVSEPRRIEQDQIGSVPYINAVVKSSTSLATNRWTYVCEPASWDDTNNKWVTLSGTSEEYTAYNAAEALNTSSAALFGYALDGDGYTLTVSAIPNDEHTRLYPNGDGTYTFMLPNKLNVECDAPASGAMAIPTLYVASNGAVTSTSGTYADVTAWGDASIVDPNEFTFTKVSGNVAITEGTFRVRYQADCTTVSSDSTIGLKIIYRIDAGSWTDVLGTTRQEGLSSVASIAKRVEAQGYIEVGSGESVDIRLQVARTAGTGTPTIASGGLFLEVVKAD